MPLTDMELRHENLDQLRRLVQSPAWELYKTHVLKRVDSSEREKARLLREGKVQEAVILQARVDGIREALDSIHQYMEGLEEPQESGSSY